MNYIKTVFKNKQSPPINAQWLNELGAVIEELCKRGVTLGTVGNGSSSSNYIINLSGVTTVPSGDDIPFSVMFIPTVSNAAGCIVTPSPSWGRGYSVYDISTGKPIEAGEIKANVPATLIFDGDKFWYVGGGRYLKYGLNANIPGYWYTQFPISLPSSLNPALTSPIAYNGDLYATRVFQGVWNDYAEYREIEQRVEAGRVVVEVGDDKVRQSVMRMEPGAMIVSDTFGSVMGDWSENSVPVCVSGRVLAYPAEPICSYTVGDPVCSGCNGTISKMTREEVREYPDRIIGTVSSIPAYNTWGPKEIKVNGRIWIKVR